MRILVIGGNGFIGSHVVDVLLARGHSVSVFDRNPEKFRRPLPSVTYIQGEMGNRGSLEAVIAGGVDAICHLASSTLPHTSNDDPIFDVQINLVETIAMLDLCVKHGVKKVVFSSSGGTVYGVPQSIPITEEHPTNPICSYGIVKLAIEKYLHLYQQLFGLEYVSFRLSNPYGIRQDPTSGQGAVAVFCARMLQQRPLTLWGNTTRDFISIADVAGIFEKALTSQVTGVFNVGSGVATTIDDLLALVATQLRTTPSITREPSRSFDVPAIVLESAKAKSTFHWEPHTTLDEGIAEVAEWLRAAASDPKKYAARAAGLK